MSSTNTSPSFVNSLKVLVSRLDKLEGRVEAIKCEPTVDSLLQRMETLEQKLQKVERKRNVYWYARKLNIDFGDPDKNQALTKDDNVVNQGVPQSAKENMAVLGGSNGKRPLPKIGEENHSPIQPVDKKQTRPPDSVRNQAPLVGDDGNQVLVKNDEGDDESKRISRDIKDNITRVNSKFSELQLQLTYGYGVTELQGGREAKGPRKDYASFASYIKKYPTESDFDNQGKTVDLNNKAPEKDENVFQKYSFQSPPEEDVVNRIDGQLQELKYSLNNIFFQEDPDEKIDDPIHVPLVEREDSWDNISLVSLQNH